MMDGLDLSAFDQIDQDVFNDSPINSGDEDGDLPVPECIGIDSAIQDDESIKLIEAENSDKPGKDKSRSQKEQELEMKMLKQNSIRRQILEASLTTGAVTGPSTSNNGKSFNEVSSKASHVMNIVEKAGMKGIDKERINDIIHQASKGSLFYKKQAQRQEEIHRSIEKMLNKVKAATPVQVENAKITCDKILKELKEQRCFNRIIVHFDLDMFFAAVEIRDDPSLADKPVAVGGNSMVSTSNYIARRFGVRAAMPGFIAKKLCPDLILIKPNGFKYRKSSSEVFEILEQYDPELTGMSLDEAYLDLTDYVKETLERDNLEHQEYYDGTLPRIWWTRANQVVEEIRQAIYDKTKLTCSAGIACNTLLAKISTDINKPNGQFSIPGYANEVTDFIKKTPVGKVSGIGKVSEQFLNALDIKTCGDIYEKMHFLPLVFYEINLKFYLRVALGDGPTCIKSDEQGRKSKSVERTFPPVRDTLILLDKLDSICEELCTKYLRPYRIRGRTITLKLKRNTFTTTTKSYSMLVATNDKMVIYSATKNLLLAELASEPPEISFRLLGVKLSNLADETIATNQLTIDAMLKNQEMADRNKSNRSITLYELEQTDSNESSSKLPISRAEIESHEQQDISSVTNAYSAEVGVKELIPGRIDSFFTERSRTAECIGVSDNHLIENHKEDTYELNKLSQADSLQNQPNDEAFQCPYCFKPYCDFEVLESHVENCRYKTSIDVYRMLNSQKRATLEQDELCNHQLKKRSKISSSQTVGSKKKDIRHNRLDASTASSCNIGDYFPCVRESPPISKPDESQKVSFYQKFIESNSQKLSQSPKVDPFQCPYCLHGFLSFNSLENHVLMCTKNSNR